MADEAPLRKFVLAELRSKLKCMIIALYCHRITGVVFAQALIDALDLREA